MRDFKKLKMWAKSHELALTIYRETTHFPIEERFGLSSQLRRAASSIPTNIAEGCGRSSKTELAHFIQISLGSASEVEYELILAKDLGFISQEKFTYINTILSDVIHMIVSYYQKIKATN